MEDLKILLLCLSFWRILITKYNMNSIVFPLPLSLRDVYMSGSSSVIKHPICISQVSKILWDVYILLAFLPLEITDSLVKVIPII